MLWKKYEGDENIPTFNDKICEELDVKGAENQILCQRGKEVITGGYGLCEYAIHVVESKYDIEPEKDKFPSFIEKCLIRHEICSSSRLRTLESCYFEIVKIFRKYPDISNIAIPIISSGKYGFPFKMAT